MEELGRIALEVFRELVCDALVGFLISGRLWPYRVTGISCINAHCDEQGQLQEDSHCSPETHSALDEDLLSENDEYTTK